MKEAKVIPPAKPTALKEVAILPPRSAGEAPTPIDAEGNPVREEQSPKESVKSIAEQEKEQKKNG